MKCPTCDKETVYEGNPYRPFCSQRCKLLDLGNWAGSDLRKMSEEAGVKPIYDKYYAWPSGFVHGQWAAVRDTAFDLCLNPLHRLHRIPSVPRIDMGSVAVDSLKLSNLLLDQLNKAYPSFKRRLSPPEPAAAPSEDSTGETAEPLTPRTVPEEA